MTITQAKQIVSRSAKTFNLYNQGITSDAIGKYFEYAIYNEIITQLGQGENKGKANIIDLTGVDFKNRDSLLGTRRIKNTINAYAADAAKKYIEHFVTNEKNISVTITNVGGRDPLGDLAIQFGDFPPIIVEAKFYSNPYSIKYFQLVDETLFTELFSKFLKGSNNPRFWHPQNGDILEASAWVKNVRGEGLKEYVSQQVGANGEISPQSFVRYMIMKGKQKLELKMGGQTAEAGKDIVIGGGASPNGTRAFILINADKLAEHRMMESAEMSFDKASIAVMVGGDTLMRLTTDKKEITAHALPNSDAVSSGTSQWKSTFYLTLGKGIQYFT